MQERTREKSRSAARMEYLKHNTESKFLRVVLQSQEKFQPKKHQKNKTINIDHIRDLPTSLSNVNSKRLDSGHRSSKVFNDLKTILHNDPMKNKNYYNASTPQTRELSKVRSFESIEDHFKNEESILPKGKNENFK